VVFANVGAVLQIRPVPGAPAHGNIRRVRATAVTATDADASPGTGPATDIQVEIHEGGTLGAPASGMGGSDLRSVPLVYSLDPVTPSLTVDSPEDVDYHVPNRDSSGAKEVLQVGVLVDATGVRPDAIIVVTLEIEPLGQR